MFLPHSIVGFWPKSALARSGSVVIAHMGGSVPAIRGDGQTITPRRQICAAYSTEFQIGKRFPNTLGLSRQGPEAAENLSFFGDNLFAVTKQVLKPPGGSMNFLTEETGTGTARALIEFHQAQSLMLGLAFLVLTFLVFRLLRSAPPSRDDTHRAGKN